MKTRKIILIAADVLLLAVCIFQWISAANDSVKNFEFKEEPDELVIEKSNGNFTLVKQGDDWLHAFGGGLEANLAGLCGGADEDAVDAALHGQRHGAYVIVGDVLRGGSIKQSLAVGIVCLLHLLVVPGCDAANPCGFALQFKMNHAVIQWAAPSLLVNDLHLE